MPKQFIQITFLHASLVRSAITDQGSNDRCVLGHCRNRGAIMTKGIQHQLDPFL